METLVYLPWRVYIVIPLMALGAVCAVRGARGGAQGIRRAVRGDATHLIAFIQGFRMTIWGLALMGIGAAWLWHLTWLVLISLAIGAGETMETSLILYALRHGSSLVIGRTRMRAA